MSVEFVRYSYVVGVEEGNVKKEKSFGPYRRTRWRKYTPITTRHSPTRQIFKKVLCHISYTKLVSTVTGETIFKLSYTGQDCQRIPEALGRLYGPQVQIFDLSYNALQSLRGLDGFIKLTELILDNNEITDSVCVPYLPHLHTLSLNKNNISNLEDLIDQVHNKLPVLTYLSLLGNKACPDQLTDSEKDENDYQRYRYYVLYRLPKLKFLDSRPVSVAEKAEALRRGKFMKVVRPVCTSVADSGESTSSSLHYTPLPVNGREADDHKGAYGKCRYRYSGKNSEGNRFIRNNDL